MQQGEQFNAVWTKVPLNTSHSHDMKALRKETGDGAALVYLCNPNNPTGTKISIDEISSFAHQLSKDQILFVDEAYLEFTDPGLKTRLESCGRS